MYAYMHVPIFMYMKIGTAFLVAAARKALFAMRRLSLLLGLRDPAKQCKLFDILDREVWGVSSSVS